MPTYTVKKRVVSVGRDYDVVDEHGAAVLKIDGKVRFARTFDIKDATGNIVYAVKEKLLSIDETFVIDGRDNQVTVKRTTTASVYPMKFDILIGGDTRMHAKGRLFTDEGVAISRGESKVASIARQQLTAVAEIFHVWIAEGEELEMMLAIAMAIVEGDQSRGDVNV